MITVASSFPFATIQDSGRVGHRGQGVPASGVADADSASYLNTLLGNDPRAAMIEIAVSGGKLNFDDDVMLCFGGAEATVTLRGAPVASWTLVVARRGDQLEIARISRGRFFYVAVRGGIDVPKVLGSRSTLLSAHFGGYDGRRLMRGDVLRVGIMAGARGAVIEPPPDSLSDRPIAVVRGPQSDLFSEASWSELLRADFRVAFASDRTGVRLEGAALSHDAPPDLPSEPACVGAIQVTGGGMPIVIMHDGPTVGGYPKIAVVRERSLSRFAQRAPGDVVKFALEEE